MTIKATPGTIMKRNPKAVCRNCPYWNRDNRPEVVHTIHDEQDPRGWCRYNPACDDKDPIEDYPKPRASYWCGRHPNFELATITLVCEKCKTMETIHYPFEEGITPLPSCKGCNKVMLVWA